MKKKSESASIEAGDADLEIPRMTRVEMRKGVMGKYAAGGASRFVGLDADVARVFRDSESVNRALRAIIGMIPIREKKRRKSA
jgi:hypothetical protein